MLLFLVLFTHLNAQTEDLPPSSYFDMTGFPQWAKDLRRGSIITFGVFPFSYFLSSFSIDMHRWANYGGMSWDMDSRQYAPWPFTAAGGISKTQEQKYLTLRLAAGSAVLIAFIDYYIERNRRNRIEREIRMYPEGAPIIIQRPL